MTMKVRLIPQIELNDKFWIEFDSISELNLEHYVQMNSKWLRSYISSYLEPTQVFILGVYDNSKLLGCLPMQIEEHRATRFWNYRILTILGNGPTDFYDIPIAKGFEESICLLFVKYLKRSKAWDKLSLKNIPISSDSFTWFKKSLELVKLDFKETTPNGYFWVDTYDLSWEAYEKEIFNPKNKDLLKSERRLQREKIILNVKTFTEDIYSHVIGNLNLYEQRRNSLRQKNTYLTVERKKFLRMATALYEKEKSVSLTTLNDETNEVWAFQLDWLVNGVRYHWNHAYNENYKRFSPGKLLLKLIMKDSFKDPNILACNHMRGLSKYKGKLVDNEALLGCISLNNPKSFRYKLTILISQFYKLFSRS